MSSSQAGVETVSGVTDSCRVTTLSVAVPVVKVGDSH